MSNRLEQLESTVMELGTEMFRLKHRVADLNRLQDNFMQTLKGLRTILDEKGILTADDFESATELLQVIERLEKRPTEVEIGAGRTFAKKAFH